MGSRPLIIALAALLAGASAPAAAQRGALAVPLRADDSPTAMVVEEIALYRSSHALVIGIDAYTAGWPRLSNAVKDAELIAEELTRHGFDVVLRTDLQSAALEQALKEFFIFKGADPEARLFVWFAGHGHTDLGEGFLVPADAPRADDGPLFRFAALSMRRFGEYVRLARSKHVYAVFDSCFSGTIFEMQRSAPPRAITRATREPVRQFLSAGEADQPVLDNGSFRDLFVRALRGEETADANRDGFVTASEIGLYLTDRVTNLTRARQTPRYGKLNDKDLDRGEFVFKAFPLASPQAEAVAAGPPGAPAEAASRAAGDREALLWQSVMGSSDPAEIAEYLRHYPQGQFAGLARRRIQNLERRQAAAVPAVPAPPSPPQPTAGVYPSAPRSGDTFKDCDACPDMVVVPAGSFVMGSPESETAREAVPPQLASWERPQHRATIARPFAVGKFEITRDQYEAFAVETGRGSGGGCDTWTGSDWRIDAGASWRNPGFARIDREPAACVSWHDARAYADWLSRKTGKEYRLLSEAEWEYAARASTSTTRHWGEDIGHGHANCSGCGGQWDSRQAAPAGSFAANAFGLHDMLGNVWEWVEDCWNDSLAGAAPDGSARTSGDCGRRVVRGGSWTSHPGVVRAAGRGRIGAAMRLNDNGFRVARRL